MQFFRTTFIHDPELDATVTAQKELARVTIWGALKGRVQLVESDLRRWTGGFYGCWKVMLDGEILDGVLVQLSAYGDHVHAGFSGPAQEGGKPHDFSIVSTVLAMARSEWEGVQA